MTEPLVLGRYRVVRRLAQGGMGVVYLGRLEGASGFSKAVIIKRILPDLDQPDNTARFIREAQILSHLQHPCIVGVLDFGETASGYAMVLEYMHGYDLGRWLKYLRLTSTPMPWEEAVFIILRALDGLHYAHTIQRTDGTPAGILHRDVSPGNILLDLEGQVRLLDFGIARALQGDAAEYKTRDGELSGKISYMAPELFSAAASSVASDVYACSLVLYLMLAGAHPFAGENESRTMWRVIHEMPAPLASFRSDLPAELQVVVLRSLAKDPQDRHQSAERLAYDLRKLLTRNEADIRHDLRQRLRRDFTGKMPALLGIEPLAERDQAWRTAHGTAGAGATPLQSSQFPPACKSEVATVVVRPIARVAPAPMPSNVPVSRPTPREGPVAPRARGRHWKLGAGIGLALTAFLIGLLSPRYDEPAPHAGRLIVIENPERRARNVPLVAVAQPERAEPTPRSAPSSTSGSAEESSTIARQLARRQVALQGCFQGASSGDVEHGPITLGFDVAASGHVTTATLEPSSLEATTVGQCLLQVAKETQFQELLRPLHFSVPLRARAIVK